MTTPNSHDIDTSSMRGFASGAQAKAADPYAGKVQVFVPAYQGDRPDSDTSSLRGYQWMDKDAAAKLRM